MSSFFNPRRHDPRPNSIAECLSPDGIGLDMNKYQAYVASQADKSRRRVTAMVGASYEEEMTYSNNHRDVYRRSSNDSNDALGRETWLEGEARSSWRAEVWHCVEMVWTEVPMI